MENPFSAVAIAATAEVIVDTKEQVSYQTTKMQREIILTLSLIHISEPTRH